MQTFEISKNYNTQKNYIQKQRFLFMSIKFIARRKNRHNKIIINFVIIIPKIILLSKNRITILSSHSSYIISFYVLDKPLSKNNMRKKVNTEIKEGQNEYNIHFLFQVIIQNTKKFKQ